MLDENVPGVLGRIAPGDVVLDLGGWARPFNRADFVIDAMPYVTRGTHPDALPAQGGDGERFTARSWIQRDLCDREPFPFGDKSVDFVICSHVLEDLRDPLWVCSEMVRIARRGYVEVPSRLAESSRGIEPGIVGWSHHRWLVEIESGALVFRMKYHTLHRHWRYSLPASYVRSLAPRRHVQWLFWEEQFAYREETLHGAAAIAAELEGFVRRTRPYPAWLLAAASTWAHTVSLARRAAGRLARGLPLRSDG